MTKKTKRLLIGLGGGAAIGAFAGAMFDLRTTGGSGIGAIVPVYGGAAVGMIGGFLWAR